MKAMASDFDGTLYFMFKEEPLRQEDVDKINEFQKNGGLFGICTGRSLRGVTDVIDKDQLQFDFYIMASGALVLDGDLQIISKTCIAFSLMKEIYQQYENQVMIIIQANDTVYSLQVERPLQIYVKDINDMMDADIYGLSFGTQSEEMSVRIADEINEKYGNELVAYSNVRNVDIVAKGCSKGKAVKLIRERYGIDEFAGIGDSYNDVPMLNEVDLSFTFTYSPDGVKEQADYVVENLAEAVGIFQG